MFTKPIVARAAVATGFCLTGLLSTACQASSTMSSSAGTPAVSGAATAAATAGSGSSPGISSGGPSATGSTSGSASGSGGSGAGTSAQSCTSSQLKASTAYNAAQNSGSTLIAFLVLTNTSAATCTLDGYTGMDFLDPSGHSLGMSTDRVASSDAEPENLQTLAPGKAASEEFTFTFAANDQGNGCENAGTIAVIPPNQTQALDTKLTSVKTGTIPFFGVCATTITVFPINPADQIPN